MKQAMVMDFNADRARSLLRTACHSSSNPNEALAAAKFLGRLLDTAGINIGDMEFEAVETSKARRPSASELSALCNALREDIQANEYTIQAQTSTIDAYKSMYEHAREALDFVTSQNEELRRIASEAIKQNAILSEEIDELKAYRTAQGARHPENTGDHASNQHEAQAGAYIEFEEFSEVVRTRCARKRWKSAVAFALRISLKEINAWETVGIVPVSLVDTLKSLADAEFEPASHHQWTKENLEKLRSYVAQRLSNLDIAVRLTREFGRRVFESGVMYQRRVLSRHEWNVSLAR